jgi:RNA polymerase sigma-70 factor (ECF subfamily)
MAMNRQLNNGRAVVAPTSDELHRSLEHHYGWLRAIVTARLGEPQAVEDVLQEVALAVVRQQAPLTDAAKIGPWLYQVAVRQTLLYRRKVGRRRKLIDGYARSRCPRESDVREPDPLEWLLAREKARYIQRSFGDLPARDREILMLKYGQNWSYKQIADHLGISESAVEARLHRARLRLRTLLHELSVLES